MTAAIDTHAFIKRMTAVGMPEPQAEVLAETLAERPVPVSKGAATEAVETLGRAVDRRFDAAERRLGGQINGVKAEVVDVRKDMAILNENQLETNRALTAIMAHLGIPKP
ncbi:MAG: hypothetical protein HQL37_08655 [Alphaproteobacteria bacterium]|nr:hypothetical protein [Alphaproteobacteria bacterium]